MKGKDSDGDYTIENPDGIKALAEAIKDSKSLSKLILEGNSLSEASKTLLRSSAPENLKVVL